MKDILYLRFLDKNGKPGETIYEYFIGEKLFNYLKSVSRGSYAKIMNDSGYDYRGASVELLKIKRIGDFEDTKATQTLAKVEIVGEYHSFLDQPLYQELEFCCLTNKESKITDNKKEKNSMFEKCFKGFKFGPATDVKLSLYGPAFKTAEGYVSYDKDNELVEVDGLVLEGSKSLCYVIPVAKKDVAIGDFIMHNGSWTKVLNLTEDGYLRAEKVAEKEVVEIIPTKNAFGFDFYAKLVPLFGDFSFEVSKDNPFGNLPMLMAFGDGNMEDILPFLLMSGKTEKNSMLMYFLMSKIDNSDFKDILPFMFINNFFNKGE